MYRINVIITLCNHKSIIERLKKMIKYFMRKTIYKEFVKEDQDILLQLISKQHIIEFFCNMFWGFVFITSFIPLFIIYICKDVKFSITAQIAIIIFILIYFVTFLISMKVFEKTMFEFTKLLAKKIYFLIFTKKGKALRKNDFDAIKQTNKKLYTFISTQMCQGYCYSICFSICKALKKGSIEFLAIRNFFPQNSKKDDEKDFTMHVLYVNNGWAFDSYSSRQFPIEKLHTIYKSKVYKAFSFEEICNKSYEDFKGEQEPELKKWAIANNCSMFVKGSIANT